MDSFNKLYEIRDILKPEVRDQISLYKKKYDDMDHELQDMKFSDKYKKEKMNSFKSELNSKLKIYTKDIFLYLNVSMDKDQFIGNIIKYANTLKDLTKSTLLDKLINSHKEMGGDNGIKYLPQEYLEKRRSDIADQIYNSVKIGLAERDVFDIRNSNSEYEIIEEPQIQSESTEVIENIKNKPSGGKTPKYMYIESKRKVGAYSLQESSDLHIGFNATIFAIIVLLLILLNQLFISINNSKLQLSSDLDKNYCTQDYR